MKLPNLKGQHYVSKGFIHVSLLTLMVFFNNCSGGPSGGNSAPTGVNNSGSNGGTSSGGTWAVESKISTYNLGSTFKIWDIKGTSDQDLTFVHTNQNQGGGFVFHIGASGLQTKAILSRTQQTDGATIINAPDSGYQFRGLAMNSSGATFTITEGQYPILAQLKNGVYTKIGGGTVNSALPVVGVPQSIQAQSPLTKTFFNTRQGYCISGCGTSTAQYSYLHKLYTYDGSQFTELNGNQDFRAYQAVDDNTVYFTDGQNIKKMVNGQVSILYSPNFQSGYEISDIYVENSNAIYATYGNKLISFDGTNWTIESTNRAEAIWKVRSMGSLVVVMGNYGMLMTRENGVWTTLHAPSATTAEYLEILLLNKNLFYGVGRTTFDRIAR